MSHSHAHDLLPVIVQDRQSRQVLMLGYANGEALQLTQTTGYAHFYSRSRKRLWKKGETSGHVLPVRDVLQDCDSDALLYLADVQNPVCHRNTQSCFGTGEAWPADPLVGLTQIISERLRQNPDASSYTQRLMQGDPDRLVQKVGEESVEVVIAAMKHVSATNGKSHLVNEICDLLYHLSVMMARLDVSLGDVTQELEHRHSQPSQ